VVSSEGMAWQGCGTMTNFMLDLSEGLPLVDHWHPIHLSIYLYTYSIYFGESHSLLNMVN
jgi:hypothetical protein